MTEPLEVLSKLAALQTGHFRLTSGRHSDRYMQCARLFEHPAESEDLCARLADMMKKSGVIPDAVAGPALGGIIMAYEVARAFGVRNIFAERENGVMTFRRGFKAEPHERVVVVEDVVTTGGSVKEVIGLIRAAGASVAGVGAIVDRSAGQTDFGTVFNALVSMNIQSWEESDCPLCAAGKPIVKPGSR